LVIEHIIVAFTALFVISKENPNVKFIVNKRDLMGDPLYNLEND